LSSIEPQSANCCIRHASTPTVYSYYADREALLTALRALAFQRFSAYLAKSRDFQDACARHLEFGTSHPRDYELLYGRGWMERVTADAQRVEIERYTTHLVRAGVDESRAAHIAYPIMMMLHGVVMHRLLNKNQSPLGRAIAAACLEACMTLLESARADIGGPRQVLGRQVAQLRSDEIG
jgi:AcrR family transcriptional regulator